MSPSIRGSPSDGVFTPFDRVSSDGLPSQALNSTFLQARNHSMCNVDIIREKGHLSRKPLWTQKDRLGLRDGCRRTSLSAARHPRH